MKVSLFKTAMTKKTYVIHSGGLFWRSSKCVSIRCWSWYKNTTGLVSSALPYECVCPRALTPCLSLSLYFCVLHAWILLYICYTHSQSYHHAWELSFNSINRICLTYFQVNVFRMTTESSIFSVWFADVAGEWMRTFFFLIPFHVYIVKCDMKLNGKKKHKIKTISSKYGTRCKFEYSVSLKQLYLKIYIDWSGLDGYIYYICIYTFTIYIIFIYDMQHWKSYRR